MPGRCPLETEYGFTPGKVVICGLPSAPGHTWCTDHLIENGVMEESNA